MKSIIDFLASQSRFNPEKIAFTFIEDSGEENGISYNCLHDETEQFAKKVLTVSSPGDTALILLPQSREYVIAFLGCLYAGVIAVPLYPPLSASQSPRVRNVARCAEASLAIVNAEVASRIDKQLESVTLLEVGDAGEEKEPVALRSPAPSQIAFLQYTSGSTTDPKGVMVSHTNIMANLKAIEEAICCSSDDVFCNWLPLFHDLGLINTLLLPIYLGAHSVIMPPSRFMRRPRTWLQAISDYKGTVCGSPNFGYDHCTQRIKAAQLQGLDLSSWRVACNAAEPINPKTLEQFSNMFATAGFKRSAFYPCYGMAEATVFITGVNPAVDPVVTDFDKNLLAENIVAVSNNSQQAISLVGCGTTARNHHVKIVDPEKGIELEAGRVGEVWYCGPSVCQGYWGNDIKTRETFLNTLAGDDRTYLRTGDLGFTHGGELYITGRIKDILIINGRNYYPQDIELLAHETQSGLVKAGGVAFENNGKIVLIQEVEKKSIRLLDFASVSRKLQSVIYEQFELLVEDILFIESKGLHKTSSGKLQRNLTKQLYLSQQIPFIFGSKSDRAAANHSDVHCNEIAGELKQWIKEELETDPLDETKPLLAIGVNSLFLIKLVAAVKEKWQIQITVRDVFEHRSVRELALFISNSQCDRQQRITRREGNIPLSLSSAQQRLWLLDKLEGGSSHYHLSGLVEIAGELSVTALDGTLRSILERHESLRTCFVEDETGQPWQMVQSAENFAIQQFDVSTLENQAQQERLDDLIARETQRPFELHCDLMLRVSLIRRASNFHLLLITMHHIAADGWSMSILIDEFNALYGAYSQGRDNPLPPLPIQYADYAHWQRQSLRGDRFAEQLKYWRSQLADIPALHKLPLDHPRPATPRFRGTVHRSRLPDALRARLRAQCQSREATLFMGLHAAFSVLLSRYSQQRDIVVGSPIANREQAEVAGLIGFFVNTLVLRSDLSGEPSFNQLLAQSKNTLLDGYAHQEVPFESVVEHLQPARSANHSPLFQIMLVMQNNDEAELCLPGLHSGPVKAVSSSAKYDLMLSVAGRASGFELEWEYDLDLFEPATVARMAGHFECLLENMLASADKSVFEVPMMPATEYRQLLEQWNATEQPWPTDKCVHELFEARAAGTPNAPALFYGEQILSYAQLNRQANRLAHYLVEECGLRPDTLVGVYVQRSAEMIVAILAVLKAGGAYVPLDPEYPPARLAYMLEDAAVSIVLTQGHLREGLPPTDARRIIEVGEATFQTRLEAYPTDNLPAHTLGINPQHLAYIIYTSGSTGQPKGVMQTHATVTNLLAMQAANVDHPDKVVLQQSSISFDVSVQEIFTALTTGGALILVNNDTRKDMTALSKTINSHSVTTLFITPALLDTLLEFGEKPEGLREIIVAGEQLKLTDNIRAFIEGNDCKLINHYGPTETHVVTEYVVNSQTPEGGPPIGRPLGNHKLYILSDNLAPQPTGVIGELYVSGRGLSRGYCKDPQLTAQKFISNPFHNTNHPVFYNRLYKTGDLARWLADGNIEFIRRKDQQVKLRGFRIEPAEIEYALSKIPEVAGSVVTIKQATDQSEHLVAYLKTKSGSAFTQKNETYFRNILKQSLPEPMIPSYFVFLDQFPLTANGKISLGDLPPPDVNTRSNDYRPPETPTESILCQIWSEILAVDKVGANDSFFALGGHSLSSTRLVSRINRHFGISLPVAEVFKNPHLSDLAAIIDSAISMAGSSSANKNNHYSENIVEIEI